MDNKNTKQALECSPCVIDLTDLNLHGLVWGDGPVTLALHGWMDNAMTFSGLAPLLQPRRFIALDFAGHGWSDHRPAGCRYHFVDYITDVCAVIARLKVEYGVNQVDLVGHSLGAAVASVVAGVIPEQINKLVLIEGLGPRTREADEAVAGHRSAVDHALTKQRKRPRTITEFDTAVKARHLVGELHESSARVLVERNLIEVDGGWRWRSDARLRDPSPLYLTEAVIRAHLQAISARTLVIRATDAGDASRRWILERLDCLADGQLEQMPGAHHLHLDDPAPVARVVNAFFRA